jgi:hypothetical protein
MQVIASAIKYLLWQMAMSGEVMLFVLAWSTILGFIVIPFLLDKLSWQKDQEAAINAAMARLHRAISDSRTASR